MDNNDKFRCPHCGSDNTASFQVVYKRGHATGTAVHTEVVGYNVETTTTTYEDGYSETKETGRTPVYGDVKHDTYSMTDLAAEVAPPEEPKEPTKEDLGCLSTIIFYLILFAISLCITEQILKFLPIESTWLNLLLGIPIWWFFIVNIGKIFVKINLKVSGIEQRYEMALQEYNESLADYKEKYREWEKSYICMRCGHRFYVDDN